MEDYDKKKEFFDIAHKRPAVGEPLKTSRSTRSPTKLPPIQSSQEQSDEPLKAKEPVTTREPDTQNENVEFDNNMEEDNNEELQVLYI